MSYRCLQFTYNLMHLFSAKPCSAVFPRSSLPSIVPFLITPTPGLIVCASRWLALSRSGYLSANLWKGTRTGVVLARVNVISKGAPPFAPRNGCDMLDRARCPAWHHCSTVLATTELESCRCCSGIRSTLWCRTCMAQVVILKGRQAKGGQF